MDADSIIWEPPTNAWEATRLGRFAAEHQPDAVDDYERLWRWSVERADEFWSAVVDEFDIEMTGASMSGLTPVTDGASMPMTRWFPGAELNYAHHMLRGNGLADDDVAVIGESQSRAPDSLTLAELRDHVRRAAAGLRRLGVSRGDRVAAYLPNISETLVAFLATASIGAVWSSCAPEFGVRAVLDRWVQIEPTVLLTVDGYRYGAKDLPAAADLAEIRGGLPTLRHTVALRYLPGAAPVVDAIDWDELVADCDDTLGFEPVPFDHPLYVLYSSGTTGLPKPIVHGHGGILLEHVKQLGLHLDLGPGDRFFWFSTTGWMMWNFLVSGLLVGSTVVLFDGNPGHPDLDTLWSLVERTDTTWAGMSAPFLMACRDSDIEPRDDHALSGLRAVGSTGAPLPAAGFRWVVDSVGEIPVASISGGTDVCSAFVGGSPVHPVVAGVIPCRQLGWDVRAFDADGHDAGTEQGELVIVSPAPSMPVGFWGDADGAKYRDSYFSTFDGVWRHGDWVTIDDEGGVVISGRSDATLNRGGVRLGTADFSTVVETDPDVGDSIVVHLEDPEGGLGELILFVAPTDHATIDDETRRRLARALRSELSPRHVPDQIVAMPAIPRTISGKKLEVPVKRILQGVDPERAASRGSLADPAALDPFVEWARSRS
ncbi:MAG: acetoacetate--CoA ligase [Ilumatobacter sp.]